MHGYELLDAGDGRRLERLGDRLVDRPAPAADEPMQAVHAWADADLRFERNRGWQGPHLDPWTGSLGELTLEFRPTEAGQVGVFPEHATHWPWLAERVVAHAGGRVLHLFAYTGATTLMLARAGAEVTHVDSSRPAVSWARGNAVLSGVDGASIRWIVDDAEAFVGREVRRGRTYSGVVLDPPTYGRGTGGRRWALAERLPALLEALRALRPEWLLLTAHTRGWDGDRLAAALAVVARGAVESGAHVLVAGSGARLALGGFARGAGSP